MCIDDFVLSAECDVDLLVVLAVSGPTQPYIQTTIE